MAKEKNLGVVEYQQELFNYLHDLGIIALQSEMQEIERIVLSMQDKNKYSEEDMTKFVSFVGKNYIKAKGFYYMKGDFEKKHKVSIHQILEQFKNK